MLLSAPERFLCEGRRHLKAAQPEDAQATHADANHRRRSQRLLSQTTGGKAAKMNTGSPKSHPRSVDVTQQLFFPDWKDVVVFSAAGPKPYVLTETVNYKAVVVGLAAGAVLPPHEEGAAIFHFLEGTGQVIVGEETFAVQAGATVVVPDGAVRGIEATTQLALLAVRLPR